MPGPIAGPPAEHPGSLATEQDVVGSADDGWSLVDTGKEGRERDDRLRLNAVRLVEDQHQRVVACGALAELRPEIVLVGATGKVEREDTGRGGGAARQRPTELCGILVAVGGQPDVPGRTLAGCRHLRRARGGFDVAGHTVPSECLAHRVAARAQPQPRRDPVSQAFGWN